ncbi:unnamed protein product [Diabrotica balteata]|uniref:Peptidase S1 domain-containing protein n=1 Tax=Diabrotica balteata TaxID=107213 RepID=A0A9P0GXA3_DIABA|nr:unnamed protein product [Diabrotica balteata]
MDYTSIIVSLSCICVIVSKDIDRHPNWKLLPKECGRARETQFRIFGGQEAELGQFPWLVRIKAYSGSLGGYNCGGGLISTSHVLTAAHCGENVTIKSVRIGEYDLRTYLDCDDFGCAPPYQDIDILWYKGHPDWNIRTLQNDVALIKLKNEAILNAYVQPLCLPGRNNFFKSYSLNGDVQLAGWGHSDAARPGEKIPDILQFVNLKVQNLDFCKTYYKSKDTELLNDRQLCIGMKDGHDTCDGDSGGPVMKELKVDEIYRYYIMGVVSYGYPNCGEAPAIYTNVRYFLNWILDTL